MDTGKVEFAPDYKSQVESAMSEGRRIAESIIATNKVNAERQRLKDAVIEAVKQWRAGSWPASKVNDAIDALIEFESKNTK